MTRITKEIKEAIVFFFIIVVLSLYFFFLFGNDYQAIITCEVTVIFNVIDGAYKNVRYY